MTFIGPGNLDWKAIKEMQAEKRAEAHKRLLEAKTVQEKRDLWFSEWKDWMTMEDVRELSRILVEAGVLKRQKL